MKTRAICIIILLALIFMAFYALFNEPRYHGRTLTSWLQQYEWTPPMNDPARREEAKKSIEAIGAKKALPVLLKLVETKDDPVSLWLIEKSEKYRERFLEQLQTSSSSSDDDYQRFSWHDAREFQLLGVDGFEILGTNAAPAVGELEKLLNDTSYDWVIKRCLTDIGKPAEPIFCRALTNRDPEIRQWSMDELAGVTDDVGVYIDRIKSGLKDSSETVRTAAVDDIGLQGNAPELAVPLLVETLKDSSDSVGAHAAKALANFGTNALPYFSTLSNLVENGRASTASAALNTLITIAPDEAFSILTNSITHGRPSTSDSIRTLANVAPEKALPILLIRMQSPDLEMRHNTFGLLLHYPATPQVASVMQNIALGLDSDFVPGAKGYLTDNYVTNHPDESLFADEPSYNGKPLGEWLKTRDGGNGEFSPEAKTAIHQLGTNAIPALLKRLVYSRPPYCFSPLQINLNAASGFIELSNLTEIAFPKLQTLMDGTNKDIALCAMIAVLGTGSNAIPFLIKGMTNQFAEVRSQAASILADDFGNKFPEQRKPAIPFYVKLLNDPDADVRGNATNQLKTIDPVAAANAGIK